MRCRDHRGIRMEPVADGGSLIIDDGQTQPVRFALNEPVEPHRSMAAGGPHRFGVALRRN